jgi:hypothetical protein
MTSFACALFLVTVSLGRPHQNGTTATAAPAPPTVAVPPKAG